MDELERRFEKIKDRYDDVTLRIRRALSWASRGRDALASDDQDAACIFYWIAFNAMYARRMDSNSESQERQQFQDFLVHVRTLDKTRTITRALAECWGRAKRDLIDNEFVSWGYWAGEPGWTEDGRLEEEFKRECSDATQAAVRGDHGAALRTLFERLYVLRNQLHHGGSTQAGRQNRRQVEAGAVVMAQIIPKFIDVIIANPDPIEQWGKPYYPLVRNPYPSTMPPSM
jgi:hypothetical protein